MSETALNQASTAFEADVLELLVYGPIGMGDGPGVVQAQETVQRLQAFSGRSIRIYVNSPGGVVYDALAIFNALKRHPARKTVLIDGVCASAATIVAMAGDEIVAADNATFMVHPVWTQVGGNAADMRREAKVLDDLTNTVIELYVAKTGRTRAEVAGWVADETWLTAAEALARGLIDRIIGGQRAVSVWDFKAFGLPAPPVAIQTHTPEDRALGAFEARVGQALTAIEARVQQSATAVTKAALTEVRTYIEGFSEGLESRLAEFMADRLADLGGAYRDDCTDPADDPDVDPADPAAGVPAAEPSATEAAPLVALLERVRQIKT